MPDPYCGSQYSDQYIVINGVKMKKDELKKMDSAKNSVDKILSIAQKHGYACIVGFRKEFDAGHPADMFGSCTGKLKDLQPLWEDCLGPMYDHIPEDERMRG